MQVNANPKKMQFDLEGALYESRRHDRTIWLQNFQNSNKIVVADRVYLWSSGVKNIDRSIGRLVAIATVAEAPTKHAQHLWQAHFRRSGVYDPSAVRMRLRVENIIEPPVRRSEVMQEYPEVCTNAAFFRNGHIQTMALLEPATENALLTLAQNRKFL